MALRLYRHILRASRRFDSETRIAVKSEAATLFRHNANLTDPKEVQSKMFEASSRLELAKHYGIAYPRLYNVAPKTVPLGKFHRRQRKPQPVPAYMDSYYDNSKKHQ
uniref:Complex 1 LYR protein domain-containing protein n=1 Tax=Spongospora subterranea TaxID=70186 RepID=A0A0H5QZG2_9EUKA|eukprot:CRZ07107.1 hypothetical protein [Spongospora subterranea]